MNKKRISAFYSLTSLLILGISATASAQFFVKFDAAGTNTGTSWADAFIDLKSALSAAPAGAEIWVAEGTYQPDTAGGSQTATFLIDKDLKIYGGFAGTEISLSERDPALHPTILSGDLNDDDVQDDFVQNRSDNVQHVVWVSATVTNAGLLDGFTIRGGHADGSTTADREGGGMTCSGSPYIRSCLFEQNFALRIGGGARLSDIKTPGVFIEECRFEHNQANLGGGLWVLSSNYSVSGCTFANNKATSGTLQHRGGGVYLEESRGQFTDCVFRENEVAAGGAGGGIMDWSSTTFNGAAFSLTNCSFEKNTAEDGGGVAITSQGKNAEYGIFNCDFSENETTATGGGAGIYVNPVADNATIEVADCLFSSNKCGTDGGGLALGNAAQNMNFTLKRCDFTENSASAGGGAYCWGEGGATGNVAVDSCLFEKDTAATSGGIELGNSQNGTDVRYQVTKSTFRENHASEEAGGLTLWSTVNAKADFSIENCLVEGNYGSRGGGLVLLPSSKDFHAELRRCRIEHNGSPIYGAAAVYAHQYLPNVPWPATASILFENCLIAGNGSSGLFPHLKLAVVADSVPDLQLLNCTIANNIHGIKLYGKSGLTLQNTILVGNDNFGPELAADADSQITSLGGNLLADVSLGSKATPWDFQNADPQFVAPGDYHLAAASLGIDKGIDLGNLPATDLDGNDRKYMGGCVDIGAFESTVVVSTDCVVGTDDLAENTSGLRLSPNPAGNFLNLEFSEKTAAPLAVEIFDAVGQLVLQKRLASGQTLDLQGLAPGVFALKTVAGERVFTGRFIKI